MLAKLGSDKPVPWRRAGLGPKGTENDILLVWASAVGHGGSVGEPARDRRHVRPVLMRRRIGFERLAHIDSAPSHTVVEDFARG